VEPPESPRRGPARRYRAQVPAADLPARLRWLPVALLAVGIAVSGLRIVAHDDDPQRSTAFAMFARVDIAANRRVLVTSGKSAVEIPTHLLEERRELQVVPTDDEAREFADLLLADDPDLDAVRVQVVGLDTDGTTIVRQELADVDVARDES
jgi:hypothetical protein